MVPLIYGLLRSSNSSISMSLFLSILIVTFLPPFSAAATAYLPWSLQAIHPLSPKTLELSQAWLGSLTILLKKLSKASPAYDKVLVQANFSALSSSPTNTFPLAHSHQFLKVAQTSWHNHSHPRTTALNYPPTWGKEGEGST